MSGVTSTLQGVLGTLSGTFYSILGRIFPPEQRANVLSKIQNFAINNPKLAAFLTAQIVLTGIPLILFITFTITVFLFSLIAALLIGLLGAILFTLLAVAVALIVVLPTLFLTTFTASFLFLWGLGGYYILKWANEGDMPAEPGKALGDKINNLAGGRLTWLMDGTRKKQEDRATGVENTPKVHGSGEDENGSAKSAPRKLNAGKDEEKEKEKENKAPTKQTDGVQKRSSKPAGGATGGATNGATKTADTPGTPKSATSGAAD